MKLTPRLTLVFILYAAALLAGVGWMAYTSGRDSLRAATLAELEATAIEKQAALNLWVEEKQADIAILAADPAVVESAAALQAASPGSPEARTAHDRLLAEFRPRVGGQFAALLVMNPDTGEVSVATDPAEEGQFKEDRPFFLKGGAGPYVQNLYYSLSLRRPAMTAAAPLRAPDGRLLGVLAGRLDLREMNAIISRRSGLRQTDDAFLVNTSNLFVTQPRHIPDPAVLQRGVHTEAVTRCLGRESGAVEADDYRGVPAIIVYRWLPERGVCLIVKIDQAEAFGPTRAFGGTIAVISALALLAAAALAVVLAQGLNRPIRALQAGAARFGQGELDRRLPENARDELGGLAREFNQMAAALAEKERQLRAYAGELEQRVADRTAELQQSEERFRLVTEASPNAMIMVGQDGTISFVNQAAVSLLGYRREALVGLSIELLLPERFRAGHPALRAGFQADPRSRPMGQGRELFARRQDGSEVPVEIGLSLVETRAGRFTLATITDITERKRAEEALRESERQMRALIASLDDVVFEFDEPGTYLNVWTANASLLARPRAELLGRRIADILGEEAARPFLDAIRRVLTGGQREDLEYPLDVASGRRWFLARVSPILLAGGPGRTVAMLVRDITERKRVEAALRESEERYRTVADYTYDWEYWRAPDGTIKYMSPACERITGYRAEEFIANPDLLDTIVHRDDLSLFEQHRSLALDEGAGSRVHAAEFRILRRDGETRWIGHTCQIIRRADGTNLGRRATNRDITDRKQRERELEVIAAVSAALRSAPTRAEMLPVILDQVLILLNADGAALDMHDPVSGEIVVELGAGEWAGLTGRRIAAGEGVTAQVLATGRPYVSNDAQADPLYVRPALSSRIRAAACAPLITQTQAMGALWLGRSAPISEGEVRLLAAIADIAASAIQRATLHEETERNLERLAALRAIDLAISSSLDMRLTLRILLEQVITQLRVDAAAVLLLNAHSLTLEYAAGRGFRSNAIERSRLPLGQGLAGQAALERRLVQRADLTLDDPDFSRAGLLAAEGFRAYCGMPLIAKGEVVGVLEIFQRAPLRADPDWLDFLEALAGQAAIAVENAHLFDNLQRSNRQLTLAYEATIEGWSRALDLRDRETEGHTQRVTEMTVRLARALAIPEDEIAHIRRGALLHDIGKMGVPDAILLKPGPLTDEEWQIMRQHPGLAYEMLSPVTYLRPALDIPYCHHEKWDGTGYPRGLKGEQIPLAARIFALADVWDALRSDRPYRPAWPEATVRAYLREQAGRHFDPQLVEVFLRLAGDEPRAAA